MRPATAIAKNSLAIRSLMPSSPGRRVRLYVPSAHYASTRPYAGKGQRSASPAHSTPTITDLPMRVVSHWKRGQAAARARRRRGYSHHAISRRVCAPCSSRSDPPELTEPASVDQHHACLADHEHRRTANAIGASAEGANASRPYAYGIDSRASPFPLKQQIQKRVADHHELAARRQRHRSNGGTVAEEDGGSIVRWRLAGDSCATRPDRTSTASRSARCEAHDKDGIEACLERDAEARRPSAGRRGRQRYPSHDARRTPPRVCGSVRANQRVARRGAMPCQDGRRHDGGHGAHDAPVASRPSLQTADSA